MPTMQELRDRFPDAGAFFNATSTARKGGFVPELSDVSPEMLAEADRYAQSADSPATALAAGPYEALKMVEQKTPLNPLTALAEGLEKVYGPNAGSMAIRPDETTTPASFGNVMASRRGAYDELLRRMQHLFKRD